MVIAVDFDGTCVTHEFPLVGKDIGAVPVLKRLVECGHKLILFTMRSDIENPTSADYNILPQGGKYLTDAVNWFKENGIELFGVNENPDQKSWTHSPKAHAQLYIDDAALGCPLIYQRPKLIHLYQAPYVDWKEVAEQLELRGLFNVPVNLELSK
jgi:hypothetical protein